MDGGPSSFCVRHDGASRGSPAWPRPRCRSRHVPSRFLEPGRSGPGTKAYVIGRVLPLPLVLGALLLASAEARASDAARSEARSKTQTGARALSRRQWHDAIQALEAAHRLVPESRNAARNLALAWSRLAEASLARSDGEAARDAIEQALSLHPERLHYQLLQGRALLAAGRHTEALRIAESLTEQAPRYAGAWRLLADVRQRTQALPEARAALLSLIDLETPSDQRQLKVRLAELDRRIEAEAPFQTHASGNFVVRYDPDTDPETVRLALTLLEDAYTRVTADLGLTPLTSAKVVLYQAEEFQRVTLAQPWVGALYVGGTLRVPIRNLERHREVAARILAHEFTHHVLRERTPALPVWWHEGIAQHSETEPRVDRDRRARVDAILRRAKAAKQLLTLQHLRQLQPTQLSNVAVVRRFYEQSHALVGWLVDRFGPGALPSFLTALGTTRDLDKAAETAFGSDVKTLYGQWLDAL